MGRKSNAKKARRAARQAGTETPPPAPARAPAGNPSGSRSDTSTLPAMFGGGHGDTAGFGACTGMEIEHTDDVIECSRGNACTDPDGLHTTGASCTMVNPAGLTHHCPACRR